MSFMMKMFCIESNLHVHVDLMLWMAARSFSHMRASQSTYVPDIGRYRRGFRVPRHARDERHDMLLLTPTFTERGRVCPFSFQFCCTYFILRKILFVIESVYI